MKCELARSCLPLNLMLSFNKDPVCQAVQTPMPSRSPSPVSIDEDSDSDSDSATLYEPSPPPPSRPARTRLAKKTSQIMRFSRSPSPLVKRSSSAAPSSYSASPPEAIVKVEGAARSNDPRKRNSGQARKGEPRRCQNMIAQKKYRDKKVHASNLVCCSP